jgi:hypothetical protein
MNRRKLFGGLIGAVALTAAGGAVKLVAAPPLAIVASPAAYAAMWKDDRFVHRAAYVLDGSKAEEAHVGWLGGRPVYMSAALGVPQGERRDAVEARVREVFSRLDGPGEGEDPVDHWRSQIEGMGWSSHREDHPMWLIEPCEWITDPRVICLDAAEKRYVAQLMPEELDQGRLWKRVHYAVWREWAPGYLLGAAV